MRTSKQHRGGESGKHLKRRDYSLFFFETDSNSRTYLRFTRLGVLVIILLIIVPLVLVSILFLVLSRDMGNVNANVAVPVHTSTPRQTDRPIIERQSPVLKTPEIRGPDTSVPNPLRKSPAVNKGEPPHASPTATPHGSNRSDNGGISNQ